MELHFKRASEFQSSHGHYQMFERLLAVINLSSNISGLFGFYISEVFVFYHVGPCINYMRKICFLFYHSHPCLIAFGTCML